MKYKINRDIYTAKGVLKKDSIYTEEEILNYLNKILLDYLINKGLISIFYEED